MISSLLRKILGPKKFKKFRKKGYEIKFKLYGTIDEEKYRRILEDDMGIQKGDVVFVHSSTGKLNINFSAFKVVRILKDVVGDEGTILFPNWHFNYRAADYLSDESNCFDVRKSPSMMGLISELARRNKEAKRSLHPTNAVVAIGKHADYLIGEHHQDIYPNGKKSPFYKVTEFNGKIIGIGEPAHLSLSFVHCIEDIEPEKFPYKTREDKVYTGKVIDYEGNELSVDTLAADQGIQNRDLVPYLKQFEPEAFKKFKRGGSDYFVVNSVPFYAKMEELTKKGITIYK